MKKTCTSVAHIKVMYNKIDTFMLFTLNHYLLNQHDFFYKNPKYSFDVFNVN